MLAKYLKDKLNNYSHQIISDEKVQITYGELLKYAIEKSKILDKNVYGILCESEVTAFKELISCVLAHKTALIMSYRNGEIYNKKIIEKFKVKHIITDEGIICKNEYEDAGPCPAAVIMCSSGTTGSPKGVMLSQLNIVSNILDICDFFDVNEHDKILIPRSLAHCSVLMGEWFVSIFNGLRIFVNSKSYNPLKTLQEINDKNISVMGATPTMMYYICRQAKLQGIYCNLKKLVISGECMTKVVADYVNKYLSVNANVYNVYGLTEAGPRVSYLPPDMFYDNPLCIGIPLRSFDIKVENHELIVKSPSVMLGYYQDDDSTAKVLKDGWLYTGDVVEVINNLMYIKGRKDSMIVRAGMNIYPQEVENALKMDDRILDALAYGEKKDTVGQIMILKVVCNDLSPVDIINICKERLPRFQYPDKVIIVDELAHTVSGKLIREKTLNA